jgi:hypothetical protein
MVARIFLSYAREDEAQVRGVYRRLLNAGFEVWMYKIDLLPGQRWQQEIPRAIRNSDFILIFFSKNSVAKRGYYYNEILPSVAEVRSRKTADLRSNTGICSPL